MTSTPIDIREVNPALIQLRPLKQDDKSKKIGGMYGIFHGASRLEVVLPELAAPFGPKILDDYAQPGQIPKVSLTLSFDGINDETDRGQRLRQTSEKIEAIQTRIYELIADNAPEYFKSDKKPVDLDTFRSRFQSLLYTSPPKDNGVTYAPTMRLNFQATNTYNASPNLNSEELLALKKTFSAKYNYPFLLNKNKEIVDVNFDNVNEVFFKGARVKAVANFGFIWIGKTSGKGSINVSYTHGRIVSDPQKPDLDLLDDEDENDVGGGGGGSGRGRDEFDMY